ncbi:MAG: hypothetical protein NXI31_04960 [bacterium]|nr:hypothetical protein [bacterium]
MKHFSNKQFLAAIVTLTLTGAAMAQDGRQLNVGDQRLSADERAAQQIQGFPGQDGPIPSKPDGSDERNWDAKAAARAREEVGARSSERADGSDRKLGPDQRTAQIQGDPGGDGPIPARSDGSDQLLSDADRVRLQAETTDRGVQFELSSSETKAIGQCGVIVISLSPDTRQMIQDYPWLLWDTAVLGFGDLAPALSLSIPSDYRFPDEFYAQGVVISSSGGVQASKVTQIKSR